MDSGFIFGGRSTRNFGISVEKYPDQVGAARRIKTISVPGRNGMLHQDEGSYDDVPKAYSCYFRGEKPTPEQSHAVANWLLSPETYQRLEDFYDPSFYRMAIYTGTLDIENILNLYGRFTAKFRCMPQAFLKAGEQPISFSTPGKLCNPTGQPALPVITVYGESGGMLSVGSCVVEIKTLADFLTLDSELQDAYRLAPGGAPENKNDSIYAPAFPILGAGESVISWTGGIQSVKIIPRWWTL